MFKKWLNLIVILSYSFFIGEIYGVVRYHYDCSSDPGAYCYNPLGPSIYECADHNGCAIGPPSIIMSDRGESAELWAAFLANGGQLSDVPRCLNSLIGSCNKGKTSKSGGYGSSDNGGRWGSESSSGGGGSSSGGNGGSSSNTGTSNSGTIDGSAIFGSTSKKGDNNQSSNNGYDSYGMKLKGHHMGLELFDYDQLSDRHPCDHEMSPYNDKRYYGDGIWRGKWSPKQNGSSNQCSQVQSSGSYCTGFYSGTNVREANEEVEKRLINSCLKDRQEYIEKEHHEYLISQEANYEKYGLQSNKLHRLGDAVDKLNKLHSKKPTTNTDTSKIEHLIKKADQHFVKHADRDGEVIAEFANNYLSYALGDENYRARLEKWEKYPKSRGSPKNVYDYESHIIFDAYKVDNKNFIYEGKDRYYRDQYTVLNRLNTACKNEDFLGVIKELECLSDRNEISNKESFRRAVFNRAHEKYGLQSNKLHTLAEVAVKLDDFKARKPTTNKDANNVEFLIKRADEAYVKHEYIIGNGLAAFASNYLEFTSTKPKEWYAFKNIDNEPFRPEVDLSFAQEAYEHLYINVKDRPSVKDFNNIYQLQYEIAVHDAGRLLKDYPQNYNDSNIYDQSAYLHFHTAMILERLREAKDYGNIVEFERAYQNYLNMKRFQKGISNFFEQTTITTIEGYVGIVHGAVELVHGAYNLVAYPIDSSITIYHALLKTPAIMKSISELVEKTINDFPNMTFEEQMSLYGKAAGTLISSFGLPAGAVKTLSNGALKVKAIEAVEEIYYLSVAKHGIVRHGPHTTHPGPATNIRVGNQLKPNGEPVYLSETFRGGAYSEIVTSKPIRVYRAYDENTSELARFYSPVKPRSPTQVTIDVALDPTMNKATRWVEIEIPAGTRILEGYVGPYKNERFGISLSGAGERQVYIPDIQIPDTWIKARGDFQ